MELMFTDLFPGTFFTAEIRSFNMPILCKSYITKKEAENALKSFIFNYDGWNELTHCSIWEIDNIKQRANCINYSKYLKLRNHKGAKK